MQFAKADVTPARRPAIVWLGAVLAVCTAAWPAGARDPVVLRAVRTLPPHVAGGFREPAAFQRGPDGAYFVFDRKAHTVYGIDAARTAVRPLVEIGPEQGRILQARAFSAGPDGRFVVADTPGRQERVQLFDSEGELISRFVLPGRSTPRIVVGDRVVSGVGSLQFTGRRVLVSMPEAGALIAEFGLRGAPLRLIGQLRRTGHEDDRDVHLALNSGIPLVDPTGGYYFVFVSGRPEFHKFTEDGQLVFTRAIQGPELDGLLGAQPTTWPRRTIGDAHVPLVAPVIRTAAVAGDGHLWVSLSVPFTYVYDAAGEKLGTVQFRGARIVSPVSLFFDAAGRVLVAPGLHEFDVPDALSAR